MATLEKIRSKSVFLIVVIGVALLAFIVGDALTNSQNIFGDRTTVAKMGGAKIDITQYQRKREELNNQLEEARRNNPQQFANFDTQVLSEMAIEQLMQEALVLNAADKAGIRSSGNALRFYMLENPRNPEVMKIVQQLNASGLSVQTPQQAYEVIFNPQRNGMTAAQMEPFQRAWLAAEKATDKIVKQQIYQRLVVGWVRANAPDKKAMYDDYVATSNVDVAFLPFGNLDEKTYPVTEQEIKDRYNKDKGEFMVDEPTREISFIAVNIAPSQADQRASRDPRRRDLPANVKEIVTGASDSARVVYDNIQGFEIVRVVAREAKVDSIQLNVISTASDAIGKRVLAAVTAGLTANRGPTAQPVDSPLHGPGRDQRPAQGPA